MLSSGGIAFSLSLVTLSGIAVYAILRRKSCHRNEAHKEDFISQLPDDILLSIISRIPAKSAISTTVLSKRWRNLYKFVSNIEISCPYLLWRYTPGAAPHGSDSEFMIYRLKSFLRLYSGANIHSFSLQCCLNKSYTDQLEQCIYSIGKLGVEKLDLLFSCCLIPSDLSFSFDSLSVIPSLKYLFLSSCSLQPNFQSQCSSLQTLNLLSIRVFPGSLECILSNCLGLQSLMMHKCYCPTKLCFRGPNLQLKSLIIKECKGVEEIEFYASNLITFEFRKPEMVNFIFDHVPQLQTVYLSFEGKSIMSHVFGKLAQDLPHLKSLTFDTKGDFYQECRRLINLMNLGAKTFYNLRHLELSVYCTLKTDLLALIPFLQSCPLLEEFHFDAQNLNYDGEQQRRVAVLHSELKKVEISGFSGTENEIEFALYILKSAVNLEQMRITRCARYYVGRGTWNRLYMTPWSEETHKMIREQLQGQAICRTAEVITQYAS